jgi:hypothetical protein
VKDTPGTDQAMILTLSPIVNFTSVLPDLFDEIRSSLFISMLDQPVQPIGVDSLSL